MKTDTVGTLGITPQKMVERSYERLTEYDDKSCFIHIRDRLESIEIAKALEAGGPQGKPLYGLTFAVKDNIDVAGMPTTCACPEFEYIPQSSAFVVEKLESAGAICIGKTNLDQFATGLVGVRSPFGTPRNYLRDDLVPGGSSSGSAIAVAAGIVAFSLGTDTAGSGRVPAALNGIVGLKPSLGALSATGMVPACRTLDTISVFAQSVDDAARIASVAQGYDAMDFLSRELPAIWPLIENPGNIIVGVPRSQQLKFFGDEQAKEAFERDLTTFEKYGAVLKEIDFAPFEAVARLLYEGPWVAERYHAVQKLIEENPDAMHPVTFGIISGATSFSAVDTFDAQYRLEAIRRNLAPLIAEIDCLAVPSIPTIYTVAQVEADPVQLNSNLGTYTNFVNLLDLAAISVPVGAREDGLPSSVTLIGQAGQDGFLASIASRLQVKANADDASLSYARPGEVLVAVVGAHLTGMPLNHQLTSRKARFVTQTVTAPDYRLFALDGTIPPKPGLQRVPEGTGAAIIVEVWALSAAAFGSFVDEIPQPLGIGSVRLGDGFEVNGFIAEGIAIQNAKDITSFGGWRAFIASGSAS